MVREIYPYIDLNSDNKKIQDFRPNPVEIEEVEEEIVESAPKDSSALAPAGSSESQTNIEPQILGTPADQNADKDNGDNKASVLSLLSGFTGQKNGQDELPASTKPQTKE